MLPTAQCKGSSVKINVKYSEYIQKLGTNFKLGITKREVCSGKTNSDLLE